MPNLGHLSPTDLALLARLKQELRDRYGDRLRNVILFGSRARGDAREDSDWDVAVVVEGYDGGLGELYALADLGTHLLFETGAVLSLKPISPADLDRHTLFMENLRDEGLAA